MAVTIIQSPAAVNMAKSPVYLRASTDKSLALAGLYIKCAIYRASDDELITTLVSFPDDDGNAVFYLNGILKTLVSDDPVSSLSASDYDAADRSFKFYCKLSDPDDADPAPGETASADLVTVNAGIPVEMQGFLSNPFTDASLPNYLLTARRKRTTFLALDQYAWWSVFNNTDKEVELLVVYRMHFRNSAYEEQIINYGNVARFSYKDIPIGNATLNLAQYISGDIADMFMYEIYLMDVSKPVHRIFVDEHRYRPVDFLFINFLGGMEFLRCYGDAQSAVKLSNDASQKFVDYSQLNTNEFGQRVISSVNETFSQKVYAGMRAPDDGDVVRDFCLSKSKFVIDTNLGRLLPVRIKSDTVDMGTKNDPLKPISFEYEMLFDNQVHNLNRPLLVP